MNRSAEKLRAAVPFLIVFILLAGAFSPALFQGKILAPLDITTKLLAPFSQSATGKPHNHSPSDAVTQYLPYRIHAEKSLREDGYIGWNPYTMGGSSLAGNTMALPGNWTLQLHRFLPFREAWNLGIFAEFLVAATGMLVFLRSRRLPWIACLLGAIAYAGNSQFIIWIYHRWALSSFCWMPWVLWSSVGGFSWNNPNWRQLLLPLFLTLALLGSTLQHMVFVGLACGCIFAGSIPDLKSGLRQYPAVLVWAGCFLVALAMGAFSILPQIAAYSTNVEIGHTRGGIGYPEGGLQPLFNLLAIPAQIWPWLLGDPQTIDAWRLLKSSFMNLAYLGTIPMVLAIAGLFVKGMPRQAKWLIVAGLLIPLTPMVGPLYHRVQLLFLLGGAWMAAEMLARLPSISSRWLVRGTATIVISLGAALLLGTLLPAKIRTSVENTVVTKSLAASADSNFGSDRQWIEERARGWTRKFSFADPNTAWTYFLLVAGAGAMAVAGKKFPRVATGGQVVVIAVTSLELFTLFKIWTTFSDPADLRPTHAAIEDVRRLSHGSRVIQGFGTTSLANTFAAPNLLSTYSIPSVEAYESIQYASVSRTMRDSTPEDRLTVAGVGIAVQPSGVEVLEGTLKWPVVESSSGFDIRRNPNPLPSLIAGSGAIPVSKAEILPSLRQGTAITATSETMNRKSFELPQGASWIRMDQNWHAGWLWKSGTTDWAPFLKGPDGASWIVDASPGPRKIEARFSPVPPLWIIVSLLATFGWISFFFLKARRI